MPTGAGADPLRRWKTAALTGLALVVVSIPLYLLKEMSRRNRSPNAAESGPTFVGREKCESCHREAYEAWLGSDHDLAMAEATGDTVLGDFDDAVFEHRGVTTRFYRVDGEYFVFTEGPGGEMGEFAVAYTFGYDPLQQYLVRFPGGRLQALSVAWDAERKEWFHLYPDLEIPPDDWLHWTRNAQNWNGMCAECHSTDLRKNYDPITDTYDTTWSEIDVSCEACHGPGSNHIEWASIEPMARPEQDDYGLVLPTIDLPARDQVELCAPCHSRRSELGEYDHTRLPLLESFVPSLLRENLYHADGQILEEVYVYGSFVQSKMFRNDVRCSDCHDVHSLKLHQEGNALCLPCHRADAYDSSAHHFHKKIYEGKPSDGALCVKCHMQEQPFMVIDERADHSMRIPRPDLTLEIGVPNACSQTGCHADKPVEWSNDAYLKWYGQARKPHYGTILAAGRSGEPQAHDGLIELAQNPLYPTIVRATALSLLAAYPGEKTTAALERALLDDEDLLRHTAVSTTNVADPEKWTASIAPLLLDPVRAVRMTAASNLAGVRSDLLKPYQREALERALVEHRQSMERSLDFAFAALNLGNLSTRLGRPDEAEAYYRRAIRIDDLFFPAKVNLSVLLNGQGKNNEAVTLLREVLDADPDNYQAAYSLGLLLAEMERYEEAEESMRRATEGMPANARVHYNRGLLLQKVGRDAGAEASLRRALDLAPDDAEFLYAMAEFYMRRNRPEEALPFLMVMTTVHPDIPVGHQLRKMAEQAIRSGGR